MKNPYAASDRKYNITMATGYILYNALAQNFEKCESASLIVKSMFLHYAQMSEKQMNYVAHKVRWALSRCHMDDLKMLNAKVSIHRRDDNLSMKFDTFGFGTVTADIDGCGDITISRII